MPILCEGKGERAKNYLNDIFVVNTGIFRLDGFPANGLVAEEGTHGLLGSIWVLFLLLVL